MQVSFVLQMLLCELYEKLLRYGRQGCTIAAQHREYLGLARTIYIRCIYGIFGREITRYTVIYGVYIRFWPIL
jgi:hypothetical protein